MLLFANKARTLLTGSVTSAAGQVAAVTTSSGALFVGVGGVATSTANPMRCVLTAVDGSGNDTGAFEVVEITRAADNLTLVSRGLEGTTAAAWSAGAVIECRPTAGHTMRGPQLLARGVGSASGTTGLMANTVNNAASTNSLLVGAAPIVFPAGAFSAGDMLLFRLFFGHRGTTTPTNWAFVIQANLYYGLGQIGSSTTFSWGKSASGEIRYVIRDPAAAQQSSGLYLSSAYQVGTNEAHTFNLTTTALSLDIQGGFASTPAATEAIYLDFYEIELHPATLP
jgi:hypothetical protein